MASPVAAEVRGPSLSRSTANVRLAVISDDRTLAGRVMAALERDGLVVRLDAADHDVSALDAAGRADVVIMARELLRDPYCPLRAARELRADETWPPQYTRAKH